MIKKGFNIYNEDYAFVGLKAQQQALFWYVMRSSDRTGVLHLTHKDIMVRLNIGSVNQAKEVLDLYTYRYSNFIQGEVEDTYMLLTKFTAMFNYINPDRNSHIPLLREIVANKPNFEQNEVYMSFFDKHFKDAYEPFTTLDRDHKLD
jgi:hypothetical protein